jgi:BlaI family transcriptional regulator, penicillinase repressor
LGAKKPDLGKVLGSRQASILEYLWQHGPQSVVDLHRGLARREELAYTTVFTELTRMLGKRLVAKSSDGGTHLDMRYRAAITREDLVASVVSDTLGTLIAAHGPAAVHGFINAVAHDRAALEELRRALSAQRKKR